MLHAMNTTKLLPTACLLLPMLFCAQGLAQPATPPDDDRLPVPDETAIATGQRLVEQLYPEQLAAKSDPQLQSAANLLLAEGLAASDDPVLAYTLLTKAADLAVQGHRADMAVRAYDLLAGQFDIDVLPMKVAMLEASYRGLRTVDGIEQHARAMLRTMQQAIRLGQLEDVQPLEKLATAAARRVKTRALKLNLDSTLSKLADACMMWDSAKAARVVLANDPDDVQANGVLGRHAAAIEHDWSVAVPLLAKGDDKLAAVAAGLEMDQPATSSQRLAVGHAWWNAGQEREDQPGDDPLGMSRVFKDRAIQWYAAALPELSGTARRVVVKRLHAADRLLLGSHVLEPGLEATIYRDEAFRQKLTTLTHKTLTHEFGHRAPIDNMGSDSFAIRWQGYVQAPQAGTYVFTLAADDQATLWINDKFVVRVGSEPAAVAIELMQGLNNLRLDFVESRGRASLKVLWSPPRREQFVELTTPSLYHEAK